MLYPEPQISPIRYVDTMREEFVAQVGEATREMEEEGYVITSVVPFWHLNEVQSVHSEMRSLDFK